MKRYLILVVLITSAIAPVYGQQLIWAKQYGRATGEVHPNKLVTDANGNIYTAGDFRYNTDFDPGPGVYALTDFSNGSSDGFIQKLNPSGDFLWVKRFGGNDIDYITDIAVDALGNSYTVGNFESDSVDFDPGPGVFTLARNFTDNGFILKLDPSGDFVWVKQITKVDGITNSQQVNLDFIRRDVNDNLYIIGTFAGIIDFNAGLAIDSLSGSGMFALKLDSAGNFVWVKKLVGTCNDVALTPSGYLYLTGSFYGNIDFDFGTGINMLNAQSGGGFVLKMDTAGNYTWAKNFMGVGRQIVNDSHDKIYLTGTTSSNSLPTFVIFHKIDQNSVFEWQHQFGKGNFAGFSIAIDSLDVLYVGGKFDDSIDADPGIAVYSIASNGGNGQVLLKMDTLGHLLSVDTTQRGVIITSTGELFRSGFFSGIVDFDPGPGVFEMNTNDGCVSIAKYSQCSEYLIAANPVNPTTCPGTDGSIAITGLDSNLTYSFFYKRNGIDMPPIVLSDTGNGLLFDGLSFGIYDSITANIGGCQSNSIGPITLIAECDSVWPGDLNYDMVANNNDVLDLLLVYGDTGTARQNASINWVAQYCQEWMSVQYNTINTMHADCNGDGIVNSNDTVAIAANYGQTHLKGTHQQQPVVPGFPDLYFDLDGIMFTAGRSVSIPVKLGSPSLKVNEILGISAQLRIDGVVPREAPKINTTVSWLADGNNNTLLFTKTIDNSRVDWAFGRIDRVNVSGDGIIGHVEMTLPVDAIDKEMTLYFDDVRIIDNKGNVLSEINVLDATIHIAQMDASFVIYPNPANKTVNISSKESIDQIVITDVLGKKVYEASPGSNNTIVDIEKAGFYFVTVIAKGEKVTQTLVVRE